LSKVFGLRHCGEIAIWRSYQRFQCSGFRFKAGTPILTPETQNLKPDSKLDQMGVTIMKRSAIWFEWFYNFAITPWAMLTPDIQVVRGAQKDRLMVTQGPLGVLPRIDKKSVSTSTVLGLRLQLVF
jgi:hypothetical protein